MYIGCECDPSYTGYDCSIRECPKGDDPMTTGQADEVQLFQCIASTGSFTLTWKEATSEPIPVTASITTFLKALLAMSTVRAASVDFSEDGIAVCSTSVSQVSLLNETVVTALQYMKEYGGK
uniref:EGF-like domain-containing protein n=1 Tax=Aplanochytrium stocchinoi TaxID=215587 RepID=A0A7S3UXS1_9STRA|mmetsp:Transcript_5236/g.6598  ORF Transcript_5236/g.6598 Transcript_5236/m.6598 type:complete len:122 (+) Transcript_5236:27-392(+)